jgi:hypothetical protein
VNESLMIHAMVCQQQGRLTIFPITTSSSLNYGYLINGPSCLAIQLGQHLNIKT